MRTHARTGSLAIAASIVLALLTGCATAVPASDDGELRVVASTNVYGGLAEAIGGDHVTVTSIVSDPSQDPHSFEGNVQVQLALSKADVVIENGGGYDDFVDRLLAGVDNQGVAVLNAVQLSGLKVDEQFNEHVWYDLPSVAAVVDAVRDEFVRIDPDHADFFIQNAGKLIRGLADLKGRQAEAKAKYAGLPVAVTEPLPLYFLAACGLDNKTPVAFSAAIESGTGVTPGVMQETLDLVGDQAVKLVVYNAQTAGPETERVLAEAKSAGVPTIAVTETVPAGQDYLSWMDGILTGIEDALGGRS
jgi:ABC-type metal ion transport system, periplasmic component/surface adhesin